jgi:MFS family permease
MFTVSAMALLLRVVDAPQRGRASAAFQGGFLFGGVAGPAVGGLVLAWSVRAPFFVYAGTLAIATVVSITFLTGRRVRDLEQAVQSEESPGSPPTSGWAELRQALGNAAYRAALGVNLTTGLATFGLRSALVPLFVIEGLRQGASLSGVAFLIAAATQAVFLLPAGRMADLRGRRPALLIGTVATTVGMLGLVVADLLTGTITPATVLFLVAMGVLGVGTAYLGSAPAAVVGDVMGGRRGGIVIATFQMVSDLGAVVGPLLAGLLLDAFGFESAFAVGAAVSAVAVALVIAMPETLKRPA